MIYFLLDPLESLYGPLRPPFLIAKELVEHYEVCFVSPMVSEEVDETLRSQGFKVLNLGKRLVLSGSLLTFEAWLKKINFRPDENDYLLVNFSQCFLAESDVYYAQGPITRALDDMYPEMKFLHKFAYKFTRPFLLRRDKGFNKQLRNMSRFFISNSKFCASNYEDWGIEVDDIIYPPLDCDKFRSITSRPSGDYVLTYVGKEAKYSVIKPIADAGVKIKAFGFKAPYIPSYMTRHPNIEFLGKVSDEELVDLYSNALYTLFTFTTEPFGYIPVESMACGTPVLTYNSQGPSESVVDGSTGWLADSDNDLIDIALKIWENGYPLRIRREARERSLLFDTKNIVKEWIRILKYNTNR